LEIASEIQRTRSALDSCTSDGHRDFVAEVTFLANGTVSSVLIDAALDGNVAECIVESIERMQVAPFAGRPLTVRIPFSI
jgi:hypothetical protein